MKPCPECGSTDRQYEDGTYALLQVSGVSTITLDATGGKPTLDGFTCRILVCRSCSAIALTTDSDG